MIIGWHDHEHSIVIIFELLSVVEKKKEKTGKIVIKLPLQCPSVLQFYYCRETIQYWL